MRLNMIIAFNNSLKILFMHENKTKKQGEQSQLPRTHFDTIFFFHYFYFIFLFLHE